MDKSSELDEKLKDSNVSETSSKKMRDGNTVHSTDPCNMQEDVSVRKRRAGDDGETPRKRLKYSSFTNSGERSQVSVEEIRIQKGKRKARKRSRCSVDTNINKPVMISVEEPLTEMEKRKTSDDVSTPGKMRYSISFSSKESSTSHTGSRTISIRSGTSHTGSRTNSIRSCTSHTGSRTISIRSSTSHTGSRTISIRSSTSHTGSRTNSIRSSTSHTGSRTTSTGFGTISPVSWSKEHGSGEICLILNDVSPEEEKIYQMSSSGKTRRSHFKRTYAQLAPVGAGGFGSVFAGYRKQDLLPVAIKHIPRKDIMFERVVCNGNVYQVILEVALMLKAAGLPGSVGQSAVVSLLDWYTFKHDLVLVMERPFPSMDLSTYLDDHEGSLEENEAKTILRQLVDAAIQMHSKGVFHRDIKLNNVLVKLNQEVPRVCFIDFGSGNFSTDSSYSSFCGTPAFFPPEWFENKKYWACSTTVWQLGALFYSLLEGHGQFTTAGFITGQIHISPALSPDCKTLLNMCLATDPTRRATLEELQVCPALRETSHWGLVNDRFSTNTYYDSLY